MANRNRSASEALIAICAYVALASLSGRDLEVWRTELRDLIPDCQKASPRMVPVRVAAEALVKARGSTQIGNAQARLHFEMQCYFALAAGTRVETWRELARETAA